MTKTIFLLLFLSLFSEPSRPSDSWFCKAVGHVEQTPVVFVTQVREEEHQEDDSIRQLLFSDYLDQVTEERFDPSFIPRCREYLNFNRAIKSRKSEIALAKKYEFSVFELDWNYDPWEK